MPPADRLVSDQMNPSADASFVENVCLPLLQSAQNEDGGWGFHPSAHSRVEPTCWALHALVGLSSAHESEEAVSRGFRFLRAAQLPDGSWPSSSGEKIGCWVTSLACWVLTFAEDSSGAVAAGLKWICQDWPQDSTLWRRALRRFSFEQQAVQQDDSYRGWGWTPGTSSWVEPTSFALIVLSRSPTELLPRAAPRRRQLGEALLYDRMCPGGGWNCGNPRVYGVPGDPLVIPTVWALLALRNLTNRPENVMSLDWLEKNLGNIRGPGSLALARICLETYGRTWPSGGPELREFYRKSEFLQSIPVTAWTCLATGARRHWLTDSTGSASR